MENTQAKSYSVLLLASGKEPMFKYVTELLIQSGVTFRVMGYMNQKKTHFQKHVNPVDPYTLQFTPEILISLDWNEEILDVVYFIANAKRSPKVVLVATPHIASDEIFDAMPVDFPTPIRFNGLSGFFDSSKSVEFGVPRNLEEKGKQYIIDFFATLGKEAVPVADRVGFVTPRVLAMIANEAAFCVMEGVATPEDIDNAMTLATSYPMGPLVFADTVGIDTVVAILRGMHTEYMQERYRVCPLLTDYIAVGHTGKLAGKGFYTYSQS